MRPLTQTLVKIGKSAQKMKKIWTRSLYSGTALKIPGTKSLCIQIIGFIGLLSKIPNENEIVCTHGGVKPSLDGRIDR